MNFTALALAALLMVPTARTGTWIVDPAHSTLGFTDDFQGDVFHGRFKQFDAVIRYDPKQLAQSHFDVTVHLDSVDTDNSERDQTLTGQDFFATAQYPTAHFVTHAFHRDARGHVTADGTLDLHGVTQPVTLHVVFSPMGQQATLDVDTTLDRLAFKLGTPDDWSGVGKQVKVHAHLVLTRAP